MKKHLIYLFLMVLIIFGCAKENDENLIPTTEDQLVFSLTTSSADRAATKATRDVGASWTNEDAVNNLDIFFYNSTGTSCLFKPTTSQIVHNKTAKTVTVNVPKAIANTLYGVNCNIYIVANSHQTLPSNLSLAALKQSIINNTTTTTFLNGSSGFVGTMPVDFLMESNTINFTPTATSTNIGTFTLKRAASKIIVDISEAKIANYTPGNMSVTLYNTFEKSYLGEGSTTAMPNDATTTGISTMQVPRQVLSTTDNSYTYIMPDLQALYSYENEWYNDITRMSYILVKMDWTGPDNITKTYYYKVLFTFLGANNSSTTDFEYKLKRNNVYQFLLKINTLGGDTPENALEITGNFDIIDWTTQEIKASLLSYNFLIVYNRFAKEYDRGTHIFEYKSSKPIYFENITSKCNQYSIDGGITVINYSPGNYFYPVFSNPYDNNNKSYFNVSAGIPINYVPLDITFRVKNTAGLFTDATLTIYPKIYITAEYSDYQTTYSTDPPGAYKNPTGPLGDGDYGSNNPVGEGSVNNFNFFTVNITTLSSSFASRGWKVGDPTNKLARNPVATSNTDVWGILGPYYQTKTDEESNKIISPKFVIATRRGITDPRTWILQQERCARYRETKYTAGKWRMPTKAELALLAELQNDPNSAIKNIFIPAGTYSQGWYTSLTGVSIHVPQYTYSNGVETGVLTPTETAVRCVHDVWRD